MAAQHKAAEEIERAKAQQLERLRYQAAVAQRQYHRVDPDNRLVAAILEARWEAALRELKQAEEQVEREKAQKPEAVTSCTLTAELRTAFSWIGEKLPQIWSTEILSQPQRKTLLRCLIDKVVLHRLAPAQAHVRIVWRGGATTTLLVPVPVKNLAMLPLATEMEHLIVDLSTEGRTDEEIAHRLTALGHHSPTHQYVLPNTVKIIRLKHRLFQKRSQSHPRHIPGYLTVPQLARVLDVTPHWIYDRIHNGSIEVTKDAVSGLYLFPDRPTTSRSS
jgi:hypothetical protein